MDPLTYKILNLHFFKQCGTSNSYSYLNNFLFIFSLFSYLDTMGSYSFPFYKSDFYKDFIHNTQILYTKFCSISSSIYNFFLPTHEKYVDHDKHSKLREKRKYYYNNIQFHILFHSKHFRVQSHKFKVHEIKKLNK